MTLFAWLFARILSLAPPAFRNRYADEALDLSLARLGETHGITRVMRALRELVDAFRTVHVERRAARKVHTSLAATLTSQPRSLTMDAYLRDFRLAVRALLRAPAFSLAAIVTLAVGIGSTALMFTTVDAAFLQPLPFREPNRLAFVWQVTERAPSIRIAGRVWRDWQRVSSFSSLAAIAGTGQVTIRTGAEPERTVAASVSRNFFETLGVNPALGRGFSGEEAQVNGPGVVVISDALWTRGFGRDPGVLSRQLLIEGEPYPIIGVMPAGFRFPDEADLWRTFERLEDSESRTAHNYDVIGRLAPGATVESASAEIATATQALHAIDPVMASEGYRTRVVDLREELLGSSGQTVALLFGAVALVLLIGCVNVINLLLARATARQSQMTLRMAIGASRGAIVRILVMESLALAIAGGLLGALLTFWAGAFAAKLLPPALVTDGTLRPGATTFAVMGLLVVGVAVLCGVVSAWHTLRAPMRNAVASGRGVEGEPVAMRVLVAVEVALAVMLLAGAGVLVRSLMKLETVDLGFRRDGAVIAAFTLGSSSPASPYAEPDARARLLDRTLEEIGGIGGIDTVGVTSAFPLRSGGNPNALLEEEGAPPGEWGRDPATSYRIVGGQYFEAMDIPLAAGRFFDARDREGAPHVAIINERQAALMGGVRESLGRRVRMTNIDGYDDFATIVGVVAEVRHRGARSTPLPEVFFPYTQRPVRTWGMTLVAETALDAAAITPALREAMRRLDPEISITVASMEATVAEQFEPARFRTSLLGSFAGMATLLAVCGVFAVVSYAVARRTREIGIRLALGARTSGVRWLVLHRALVPVIIGSAIGVGGAFAGGRLLSRLTFEVSGSDPISFVTAVCVLIAAALAGALLPAARAVKIDPLLALRTE